MGKKFFFTGRGGWEERRKGGGVKGVKGVKGV